MIGRVFDRVDDWFDRTFVSQPGWVVIVRLFLGLGWLRAAASKVFHGGWWSGELLVDFVAEHDSLSIGWYRPVLETLIVDHGGWWAGAVLLAEIAIGITLLLSVRVLPAAAAGIFLCLNFLLAGSTNPSVFYLVLQLALVLWILEAAPSISSSRWLRAISVTGIALTIASVPYINTMRPALVIEDPGAVLATVATCAAVAAATGRRRVRRSVIFDATIDLRTERRKVTIDNRRAMERRSV